MKRYEMATRLPDNTPLILRLDGRAFHTLTRQFEKPYDLNFIAMMDAVGTAVCESVQNCRLAYLQSDEISVLILNRIESSCWFDNQIQKICSISSSLAASVATKFAIERGFRFKEICFDSRVNVYPPKEVVNYFIWRQKDWERNSIQMLARSLYTHKQLNGKSQVEMHDMIFAKGQNWNDLPAILKRGRCVVKIKTTEEIHNQHFDGPVERSRWVVDQKIPIFTKDKNYIEKRLLDDYVEGKGFV
jgi:tRNA(His) 5'-end guanylyltransferase